MPVPAIVPFLPLIGQAVGQGISALGGARAAKREGEFYGDLQTSGEAQARELERKRSGMYGMGPTMRKYMQYAMQDPTADLQRQEALRQSGTAVGALKSGGARAILGGLGAQQQQAASNMAQIGADEYARMTGAMKGVGQMEERLRQEQRGDIGADLISARQQAATGMAGAFMADQRRRAIGTEALAGLAGIAGQAAGMAFADPSSASVNGAQGSSSGTGIGFGGGGMGSGGGSGMGSLGGELNFDGTLNLDGNPSTGNGAAQGTKVKRTPGIFSHRKNPIDVMQGGAKIGELTGGEYVLNPEQAKKIANQSKYAKMLFRKFDKQQPA